MSGVPPYLLGKALVAKVQGWRAPPLEALHAGLGMGLLLCKLEQMAPPLNSLPIYTGKNECPPGGGWLRLRVNDGEEGDIRYAWKLGIAGWCAAMISF